MELGIAEVAQGLDLGANLAEREAGDAFANQLLLDLLGTSHVLLGLHEVGNDCKEFLISGICFSLFVGQRLKECWVVSVSFDDFGNGLARDSVHPGNFRVGHVLVSHEVNDVSDFLEPEMLQHFSLVVLPSREFSLFTGLLLCNLFRGPMLRPEWFAGKVISLITT